MVIQFVDRDDELNALKTLLQKESESLILLYGRRKTGKTRLTQKFMISRVRRLSPSPEVEAIHLSPGGESLEVSR